MLCNAHMLHSHSDRLQFTTGSVGGDMASIISMHNERRNQNINDGATAVLFLWGFFCLFVFFFSFSTYTQSASHPFAVLEAKIGRAACRERGRV